MTEILGLPRSYFYQRIADAMHVVIDRGPTEERQQPEMVEKVDLQEALERLKKCPICGGSLITYEDYPQERSCCGDFTITAVWLNGDISYQFKVTVEEPAKADVVPPEIEEDDDRD